MKGLSKEGENGKIFSLFYLYTEHEFIIENII